MEFRAVVGGFLFMKQKNLRNMVFTALFMGIIIVLSYTPLGYINLGIINATIIHIPVIIGSILLGPVSGGFLGFVFAMTSLVKNMQGADASILSFVFNPYYSGNAIASLIIVIQPRFLTGIVPYYTVKLLGRLKLKNTGISYAIASFLGSMTNTLLVMNFIYIFFAGTHAGVIEQGFGGNLIEGIGMGLYGVILSVIVAVGIPEAIVAAVLSSSVCKAFGAAKIAPLIQKKSEQAG